MGAFRRRAILFALAAALAGGIFYAPEALAKRSNQQLIELWDKDGDKKLSKAEWKGKSPFKRFDANKDGFITLRELYNLRPKGRSQEGESQGKSNSNTAITVIYISAWNSKYCRLWENYDQPKLEASA